MSTAISAAQERANARNALAAGFLGWTLDAFDFFVVVFLLSAIAKDFGRSIPDLALTLTASLAMRPVGAFVFGLLADHYGRRWVLLADILFYTLMEVLSGLAPTYTAFLILRFLYGIGMGGNWGVGASLALESVPVKRRGTASGLLQQGYAAGNGLAAIAYFTVYPVWGWRAMFFVGAIPALLTLFLCLKVKEPEAWREARTDWSSYRAAALANWPLFLYLVAMMASMNFIAHGTQDMYPTFLQRQRHFDVNATSLITLVSVVGAIIGGILVGHYSDRFGRRRSMVLALFCGLAVIPLWVFAPTKALIFMGAFLMQFMVQGAWGVVPAHINELSPPQLRGFFPGLAYQCGVLIASSIAYIEARFAQHFSYAASMGIVAALVLLLGIVVVRVGPEHKGKAFVGGQPSRLDTATHYS